MTLYVTRHNGTIILKGSDEGLIRRLTIVLVGLPGLAGLALAARLIWDGYAWWQKAFIGWFLTCCGVSLIREFFIGSADARLEIALRRSQISLHRRSLTRSGVESWSLDAIAGMEISRDSEPDGDGGRQEFFRPPLLLRDGRRINLPWKSSVEAAFGPAKAEIDRLLRSREHRSS